jgi:pSer/pThr/pTyr-binding forkhead associated (FHA) protein
MKLYLVVLTPGKAQGQKIAINRTPFLIGRDPKCHLRPASAMVSGQHCVLHVRQGKIYVGDLGSTNGTFVNEVRVEKESHVRHGDRLRVGPLAFAVSLETGTPVDQPTPLPPSRANVEVLDDEAVAAVLLSAQDEDPVAPESATLAKKTDISGTTEIQNLSPESPPADGPKSGAEKPAEEKKAKAPAASTASAAEELLHKYLRRPRKT